MEGRLAFCTLGMFIIDEIEYINGKAAEKSILGGAGTYAAIGARLAAGAKNARRVSWIVDMGSDFPLEFVALIDSWRTGCIFRYDKNRLSTRAWNGYGPNDFRAFKYLTPKLRLEEHSLSDEQVLARSFHMVCSPTRCISLIQGIKRRRDLLAPGEPAPIFVWEPVPDLCTPEELDRICEAAAYVDVISPNADELVALFPSSMGSPSREDMVAKLLRLNSSEPLSTALVVREGADGCTTYVGSTTLHLNPYHRSSEKVIDPTGGGNTFLGALALGLAGAANPADFELPELRFGHRGLLIALIHANVAAGYAIEQTGMPTLSLSEADVWNGEAYMSRFLAYISREMEAFSATAQT